MSLEEEVAALKAALAAIRDRQDIADCIQRESRARDRQDAAQIDGCWWEDGVDEHGAVVTLAPDYAVRANAGHRGAFHMTSHNITNHLCEIDGDRAYCESYVIGGLRWLHGRSVSVAFGRYIDQLERRNGEWRIAVRRCTIEMTSDGDPNWLFSEAIQGFLKPLWSRDDPSYERPVRWRPKEEGERW